MRSDVFAYFVNRPSTAQFMRQFIRKQIFIQVWMLKGLFFLMWHGKKYFTKLHNNPEFLLFCTHHIFSVWACLHQSRLSDLNREVVVRLVNSSLNLVFLSDRVNETSWSHLGLPIPLEWSGKYFFFLLGNSFYILRFFVDVSPPINYFLLVYTKHILNNRVKIVVTK